MEYMFKVICVGDTQTGKTHFLESMHKQMYLSRDKKLEILNTIPETIGMQFYHKVFKCTDSTRIKIHFWDLSGQLRFRKIVEHYYTLGDAILLFFDTSNIDSLENIKLWKENVHESIKNDTLHDDGSYYKPIYILIGNTTRTETLTHMVGKHAIMRFSRKHKMKYFEYNGTKESIKTICAYLCKHLTCKQSNIYSYRKRKVISNIIKEKIHTLSSTRNDSENENYDEDNECTFLFRKCTYSTVGIEPSKMLSTSRENTKTASTTYKGIFSMCCQ